VRYVISLEAWQRLNADVLRRCQEQSAEPMSELKAATGIDWFEPGMPWRLPATPGTRDLESTINGLPRALRRQLERTLTSEDSCGAYEVIGTMYDAQVETSITGEDLRAVYLEYLSEVGYSLPVLRLINALYLWLTGDDALARLREWAALLARLSRALERSVSAGDPRRHHVLVPRPPPLIARPQVLQHGPPTSAGTTA
jgi:hypothetical protein